MSKKRGQNEGSIYQRKDGSWCAQVTIQGRRLTKYTKTKGECREWLKSTLAQIDNGLTFAGAQASLGDYMQEWLMSIKPSLRPKTWNQYSQENRMHITPILGNIKLKDVRPDQVQALYNAKLEEGKSRSRVRIIHAVLHRAFEAAIQWGLIGRNPADAVSKPRPLKKAMKVWNEEQLIAFLSVVAGTRYEALYYLAITTGLRQGELLGLLWSDIDWLTGQIHVQRQLQRVTGEGLVLVEPKTKAGNRVVVVGSKAIDKLRKHFQMQQFERQVAGKRWQENDLIFTSTIGTPNEPRNAFRNFKDIRKLRGYQKSASMICAILLLHSCCSREFIPK
jgi:integrase